MNARYYNSAIGRFTSQDAVFWAIGNPEKLHQLTGEKLEDLLIDPQNLNSYAYARNNPLIYTDPTGNYSWNQFKQDVKKAWQSTSENTQQAWNSYMDWREKSYEWQLSMLQKYPNEANALLFVVGSVQGVKFNLSGLKTNLKNVEVESFGKVLYKGSRDLEPVLKDISSGKLGDRGTFENDKGLLPQQKSGYYKEYEVPNTPNYTKPGAGPERIVTGQNGEVYYTPDHYKTFTPLSK